MSRDFFFSEKPSAAQFPLSFFFLGKRAPDQILTGLVELVVEIDSARFHLNVLLTGWRLHSTGSNVSWTLPLVLVGFPLKNFFFKKENFLKGTETERTGLGEASKTSIECRNGEHAPPTIPWE